MFLLKYAILGHEPERSASVDSDELKAWGLLSIGMFDYRITGGYIYMLHYTYIGILEYTISVCDIYIYMYMYIYIYMYMYIYTDAPSILCPESVFLLFRSIF